MRDENLSEAVSESNKREQEAKNDTLRREPYRGTFKVKLTEAEKSRLGLEMGAVKKEVEAHEKTLAGHRQTLGAKIKLGEERMSALAEAMTSGVEEREIEVYKVLVFATNTEEIRRTDTGELVESGPMSSADRQMTIYDKGNGKKNGAASADAASPEDAGEDETEAPTNGNGSKRVRKAKKG